MHVTKFASDIHHMLLCC